VKVAIIGGAGFVGSHTADAMTSAGHDVTVVDMAPSKWLKPNQSFSQVSLLDQESIATALAKQEVVYHFAGIADIGIAASSPRQTIEHNILGTTNVLEACVEQGVKRFVFASTVYVYSDQGSFYRVSKQAAESIIETYQIEKGLPYTILRYGSLYGPRAQPWNGLQRLIQQAITTGRIEFPGDGSERREYIHVEDAAALAVKILANEYINRTLTLTGSQILHTSELLGMIKEILGKDIEIEYKGGSNHYSITPYRYTPKTAHKLAASEFIDIGQGILDIISELHQVDDHTK
jgi:UDP-glucose 4-epimerase